MSASSVAVIIERARRQGVTLTFRDRYDLVVGGRRPSQRLLREIASHRRAIVRALTPLELPTTCVDCGGPLPAGHRYRCHVCVDLAVRKNDERRESTRASRAPPDDEAGTEQCRRKAPRL
jgi:hypothetical protein